jgi:magnesium-transporting ATPase (P-type)
VLVVIGVFGVFLWGQSRGLGLEESRTLAVNTIVVMEVFYLFSVRYMHGTALTWRAVLGTPAVLAGVSTVTIAQFVFTYWPPMQGVFRTRPVALADGLVVVATGVALLFVLELEKRIVARLAAARRARHFSQIR